MGLEGVIWVSLGVGGIKCRKGFRRGGERRFGRRRGSRRWVEGVKIVFV